MTKRVSKKIEVKCCVCGKSKMIFPYNKRKTSCCSAACFSISCSRRITKHGQYKTRLYRIWRHVKSRCKCETNRQWEYYGGRGITICDDWCNSFEKFKEWADANGYQEDLEIDRRNTNGNYEPGNCRWATRKEQMRNIRQRKDAKASEYKGVSYMKGRENGKPWRALIYRPGFGSHIGTFKTEIEAAEAYDAAAILLFGEFANPNFERNRGVIS